ncbi:hypothetical protein T12_8365 [Trichinella patagoniensis]|uniref:Uncharacterized protein n=1 Tax=Trichinella patagoniensis TaxID=990121 RepID=A0A0V0ZUP8_9BILA|nr:hypothetical protein T12_8365 [Trichinella patagoniensis]
MDSILRKKELLQPIRPSLGIQPEVSQLAAANQTTFFYKVYIVIFVAILCAITAFGLFKMYNHESQWITVPPDNTILYSIEPGIKLPDIVEVCLNQSINGHCFTSYEKYVTDCTLMACDGFSTVVDLTDIDMNAVTYNRKLFLIPPNGIPCSETGWCFNGKCVETDDIRVKEYYLSKEETQSMLIEKKEKACLMARGSDTSIDEVMKHIGPDDDKFTVDCRDSKPVRLHLFTCENPAPSHKSKMCDMAIPFKINLSVYVSCMKNKWQSFINESRSMLPQHLQDYCRFYNEEKELIKRKDGSQCANEDPASVCIAGRCVGNS